MSTVRGVKFIGRSKPIIDLKRHGEIMEDALDRIKVKEALEEGDFITWDEAKKILDKKHGINGVHGNNKKKGVKVSRNRS